MTRNWKNVISDPACGYSDVSCSSVIALLLQYQFVSTVLRKVRNIPAAASKDQRESGYPRRYHHV
jgi:hypothetical protein